VLTAGHCILDGGVRAAHLSFVPAYDHGHRPFGTFHATSTRVMERWRLTGSTSYDLGALIVAPNRRGRLTDVVGARDWVTGRSRLSRFQIFGYPAASLFGQELRTCAGVGLDSDPFSDPGPPTVPSRCDMAAGASGGGWLLDGRYLNGVTSYSYPHGRRLFSPYFGVAAAAFLRSLP
jgi:V8-like Glu-specific endopeptidase